MRHAIWLILGIIAAPIGTPVAAQSDEADRPAMPQFDIPAICWRQAMQIAGDGQVEQCVHEEERYRDAAARMYATLPPRVLERCAAAGSYHRLTDCIVLAEARAPGWRDPGGRD